jgi:predicted PurR-regulated permease PerM
VSPDAPPTENPLTQEVPRAPDPVVVPRWIQLVILPLALLGVWALARASGPVLLVFAVASVIALILNPVVEMIEKPLRRAHVPRGLAVAAVYLVLVVAVVGVGVAVGSAIVDQVASFQRDLPHLVDQANEKLADLQRTLDDNGIKVEITRQGQTALQTLQDNVSRSSGDIVAAARDILARVVEGAFGLILVIVISIYMLLYAPRIGRLVRSVLPKGDGTPQDDFPRRAQKAVFNYVRGQLLFSLIMGVSAGIVLWFLGVVGIFPDGQRYAIFFGAFYGVMELVPYIGPILGGAPPALVALFQDPLTGLWVILALVALQQLEGHVVAPQVFGRTLRINPLLVLAALLIGGQLYGIIGAFVALPLAALARETVLYLRRHLVLEPWGTPSADEVVGAGVRRQASGVRPEDGPPPTIEREEVGAVASRDPDA